MASLASIFRQANQTLNDENSCMNAPRMHSTANPDLFQDCVPDTSKAPSSGNQLFDYVDTLEDNASEEDTATPKRDASTRHNIAPENYE